MRVFVTGARGLLARALTEAAAKAGGIVLSEGARPALDLERPWSVLPVMQAFAPDVVINAAAYTGVDAAESEVRRAFAVNRDGAAAVARAAGTLGAPVIQLSTDYVFDGAKAGPYSEDDPTAPLNVYGASKLAGEAAASEANPRTVILRTAWLYAPYGRNFVRTVAGLAEKGRTLRVVDDQLGCPTYAPDLAEVILAIARQVATESWRDACAGVIHAAGPEPISWCGFARRVIDGLARRGGPAVPVEPTSAAEAARPARRPANSSLASERLATVFGLRFPPFGASLDDCLDRMAALPAEDEWSAR